MFPLIVPDYSVTDCDTVATNRTVTVSATHELPDCKRCAQAEFDAQVTISTSGAVGATCAMTGTDGNHRVHVSRVFIAAQVAENMDKGDQ